MPFPRARRSLYSAAFLFAFNPLAALAQEGMPPAEVGIVTVARQDIPVSSLLPGRIAPVRMAEVRARVDGIVESRDFQQGAEVKAGDVLFHIDPATYEVAVEAARAGVARAEAVLVNAKATEARQTSLSARNVAAQAELDSAVAGRMQAEADLAAAKATLKGAEINLGYTQVTAPISGKIGKANVTEGALVQAGGAVILTTIQDLATVYADIQQPVSELLRLRQALAAGDLQEVSPGAAQARLVLEDGTELAQPGRLLFSEASVDPDSGQVTLRVEFPNAEGALLPGMFVRVAVEQGIEPDAIAVPAQAVQMGGAQGPAVYVVGQGDLVELRPVKTGRALGSQIVIAEGLQPQDRVIVEGIQKIGPGAPVRPVDWTAPDTRQALN
jgi:membrane fusion protein (multidrug efflux system)